MSRISAATASTSCSAIGPTAAMVKDLRAFYPASRAFVAARRLSGPEAILASWAALAAGETPPRDCLVLSF